MIIVTGGSGKVGRACVRDLMEHGYRVLSLDTARPTGISNPPKPTDPTFSLCDITDFGQVMSAFSGVDDRHEGEKVEAVVHLGAIAAPGQAHDEDVQFWFGQGVSHRIDKATVIAAEISERAREAGVGGDQLLGRITLTRRIAPGVEVALGVSSASSAGIGEIRPEQAIILTQGVLAFRSRLEERMIDGAETVLRLRERLALAVPLDRKARWTFLIRQAAAGAGWLLGKGRNVMAIRKAPMPMPQAPT